MPNDSTIRQQEGAHAVFSCHCPTIIAGSGALPNVMAAWQQAPVAGTLSQKVRQLPLLAPHDTQCHALPFHLMVCT
jgi:hypothetical protein